MKARDRWLRSPLAIPGVSPIMLLAFALLLPWFLLALTPAAHADGGAPNLAYVAATGADGTDVAVVDIGQRSVVGRIHVGGAPAGVVLTADGHYAYVTEAATGLLAIIDASDKRVTATIPIGPQLGAMAIDFNRQNQLLYIVETGTNRLAIVDPTARRILAQIPVGNHPTGVALASSGSGIAESDDNEIYVTSPDGGTVSVVSAVQRIVLATIPVPGGPEGVVVPSVGGVAYISTQAGTVMALGLADHRLLGTVLSVPGAHFGTMDYDAATGQIYVPDAAHGVVDVVAPVAPRAGGALLQPRAPSRVLQLGGEPSAVAITFEGSFGFVAERAAGRIVVLDVGSHTELGQVAVGGAPVAVVAGPYPPIAGPTAGVIFAVIGGFFVVLCGAAVWSTWRWESKRRRARSSTQSDRGSSDSAQSSE